MEQITNLLNSIDSFLWGPPLLILLVGTGAYLTFRLKFLQIRKLPLALKLVFSGNKENEKDDCEGDVTPFAALCTALSATIGTGNIVGVATALKAGGPGALFWMWLAAFFGMATKYAEGLLAVKYRVTDENGQMSGGPMYYLSRGLNNKFLANMFAVCGVGVAFFGIGTFTQVNSISAGAKAAFNVPIYVTAAVVTILVALITLGGVKRISKVAEKVVPFMTVGYVLAVITIIVLNINQLFPAIKLIVYSAFNPKAALGGSLGITVMLSIQRGVGRGVFSNEAGLGSAPIAAAAAKTNSPARQGLIAMTGTFLDTMVVCTMTGLVLVITNTWHAAYEGPALTTVAFNQGLPFNNIGGIIVNVGLMFFAFTTILGWNYYGERCTEYLGGVKYIKPYKIVYIMLVAVGAFLPLETVFIIADIVNGLMAIPNLIGIIGLRKVIAYETNLYLNDMEEKYNIAQMQ
ncbi:MAG: sodium:alanine symporter family protein [Inconstantimicrobium porci]|uniref:alanine/glycine:cation symporter family protein n=1 Tax=Inconstantimicrobium porci TaxID=2652291 RepID=UPI002A909653|nr:sodium:alanine symporter family protein [Inconstantimicrobium porci]MDY5911214.1 sodium:alanine symporter family protein [Inconstantimicrobium porci]